MAHGLSFLFEVKGSSHAPAAALIEGLTPKEGSPSPDILHYLWAVEMPNMKPSTPDGKMVLLTTVYDEEFEAYIRDLVLANPAPFNLAAKSIVGLENFVPVEDAKNLPGFIEFVRTHDLTKGGTTPFKAFYPYTVAQIRGCFASS